MKIVWKISLVFIFRIITMKIIVCFYCVCMSSSCRAVSTDLPDPLSPPICIIYRS